MQATLETNIAAWNSAFADYVKFTSKTPQEALEHKVKALGIALWRGFTAHQFGGVPRNSGVAVAELAARTASGRGTKIRGSLLAEYQNIKNSLNAKAKSIRQSLKNFGGTLDQWSGLQAATAANRNERIGAWQSIVDREVHARQTGIGELGAAFLWYRNRGAGEARHLMLNRRGKTIGSVDVSDGVALIAGNVDGMTIVDQRYGVVNQAIADETDDTLKFVKERQEQAASKLTQEFIG